MISTELRNLLGLKDSEKRMYVINTDQVSKEEYEYCQVLNNVLWGEHGLVKSLGPTWAMVHDPRFSVLEAKFITNRPAVFGGDARLGKQYIDGEGIMSHSLMELETYSEIIGEGRHFLNVVASSGHHPREFYSQSEEVIWKYIKQECPNYFEKETGAPNQRAQRLYLLIKADLLGLIYDYAEVANLQEWVHMESGLHAEDDDFQNTAEDPIVYAEIDYLERALTTRAALRVTAAKILHQSGLMKILENKFELTDPEIDQVLTLVYETPYDKFHEIPGKVLAFARSTQSEPNTLKRMLIQCAEASAISKKVVRDLKSGALQPITATQGEIKRELSLEERQVLAIHRNPNKLELFLLLADAERTNDTKTVDLIKPIIDDPDYPVDEQTVIDIKTQSRGSRVSSTVKNILDM